LREDGRQVGGKGWKERVYNGEEWKKLLRMARNRRILRMPRELLNECILMYLLTYPWFGYFCAFAYRLMIFFKASSSSTTAALPLRNTAKSENTRTSVPATHVPAENNVPASHSVSLYRDG